MDSEALIQITHINLALVLYGFFGIVAGLIVQFQMLRQMEFHEINPIGALLCLVLISVFWPVFAAYGLWCVFEKE